MNKKQLQNLVALLNERYKIALDTDKRLGNEDGATFLPNNVDYIYYQAILDTLNLLGIDWKQRNGEHILYQ